MADPIPAADPALLAAQAKAGQAGVDAYKAARNELANQRQQAVQQAMQEAALRGSPAGAMASIQSTITSPYDQGIAAMTAGSANYQADMASRDRRMADYNAAVGAARSYIPQQVELAVAPIRAQGEANARLETIRGQQNVAGIQADTQLALARMAAALQAAQIKAKQAASAKAQSNTLNQGELSAMMSAGAADVVSGRASAIEQILGSNVNALGDAVAGAAKKIYSKVERPQDAAGRNAAYWAMLGAHYTQAGIAEQQIKDAAKTHEQAASNPSRQEWDVVPGGSGSGMYTNPYDAATPSAQRDLWTRVMTAGAGMSPGPSRYSQAEAQVSGLASRAARSMAQVDPNRTITPADYLGRVLAGIRLGYANTSTVDAASGKRIFMTPEQIRHLDPQTAQFLHSAAAEGDINQGSFPQIGEGAPGPLNQGYPGQAATQAVRDAMVETATKLQQAGYNIDVPQMMNAMPNKGMSLYNLLAAQRGGRTSQEEYDFQSKQAAAEQAAGTKQDEADKKKAITVIAGKALPPNLGTNVDAYRAMYEDPTSAPQFHSIDQALKAIISKHSKDDKPPTTQQLVNELEAGGVTDQYLISLALFMNRRM